MIMGHVVTVSIVVVAAVKGRSIYELLAGDMVARVLFVLIAAATAVIAIVVAVHVDWRRRNVTTEKC